MKRFINFLGKMHSASDEVSSKRVYASFFVVLIIVMCVGDQYLKYPVDKYLFTSILTTMLGLCGMNLTAQIKAMEVKKDVASDIVNSTQDNETAKQVLQSKDPSS